MKTTTTTESDTEEQLSYRGKMYVNEIFLDYDGASYAICPRCGCLMDREYVPFCSQCGQRLGWLGFCKAKIINR